jgi:general stress protein YciG
MVKTALHLFLPQVSMNREEKMQDSSNNPEKAEKTKPRRGGAGNFAANKERAAEAGRKGGQVSGGNFRNDPERAIEAGRKGGKISRRK